MNAKGEVDALQKGHDTLSAVYHAYSYESKDQVSGRLMIGVVVHMIFQTKIR